MIVDLSTITEVEPHFFTAEAREIGLRPGEWPVRISTTIGNKMPLICQSKRVDSDGDLMWVTYRQANGCVFLRVYND